MNTTKIIYWITTSIVSIIMLISAYQYFNGSYMIEAYKKMGFPDFLRVEIGVAKIIGAIVLFVPFISAKIKEWAYAGFFILFFSAGLTHHLLGDPIERVVTPSVLILILLISNKYFSKIIREIKE